MSNLFNPGALAIVAAGSRKFSIKKHSPMLVSLLNSFRITSPFRLGEFSAGSTISLASPRGNSFASSPGTSGTSRSTSAATLLTSANGPGFTSSPSPKPETSSLFWIPEGFAHGFLVLSETAEVLYKTTNLYYPQGERSILWNDPTLNIAWPLETLNGLAPSVSPKDAQGKPFLEAELPTG